MTGIYGKTFSREFLSSSAAALATAERPTMIVIAA
jgi:hypothetical protein